MGVGNGGGLVAVGVSVGGGVFEGVGVGPVVGDAVAVAVLVAVGSGVGELVDVATIGGSSVLVADGVTAAVSVDSTSRLAPALFSAPAWLTCSCESLANIPDADSNRMTSNRSPAQPMPSIWMPLFESERAIAS